jgi:hypothetical protein
MTASTPEGVSLAYGTMEQARGCQPALKGLNRKSNSPSQLSLGTGNQDGRPGRRNREKSIRPLFCGAVDNTQRLAHDFRLAGKQKPERKRHAEHPLAHGLMGQYFFNQQGGTFCHTTCPATGAEAAALATEGDQMLRMAGVTLDSQKTMLKTGDTEISESIRKPLPWSQ